jgi:hypothetical protein
VRTASNLKSAKLLMRAEDFKGAETKLRAIAAELKENDPQRGYLLVNIAQAQIAQNNLGDDVEKQLTTAASGGDDALKAAAHNALGEFFEMKKQPEEAFWHYLRVDVMFSQDREEDAKALYHLVKLFDSVRKDLEKSQKCYDRLTDKSFAGTEYQAKALKEKPKEAGGDKKAP